MSDYLTVPEAADFLRISVRKVYDLVSRSGLPHRRAGGRLLFERASLAQWLRSSGRESGLTAAPPVLAGSHDALLDWAVRASRSALAMLCRGSRDGLARMARGDACAALLHLPERPAEGSAETRFNVDTVREAFAGQDVVLLNWCWRQQGLMVAPGNPLRLCSLADLSTGGLSSLARVGRRAAGAGSRELFDRLIAGLAGPTPGDVPDGLNLVLDDLASENDAAAAVRQGRVDVVFGAQSAAQTSGLDFVPVVKERVDLLVSRRVYFEPPMQALLAFCRSAAFADYAAALGGYDLVAHGAVIWNAP